jgi:hypothetical protein
LLTRKKAPPAPDRTDIYSRMDKLLKLPAGELARVADSQRKGALRRELEDDPAPLFHQVRALILHKCNPGKAPEIRAVFEKQPFGELERLVTQKLLDVVKRIASAELQNDRWLRMVARLGARSFEEMRVMVLEFLDTDIFHLSEEQCVSFLDPLIASWDVDLATFRLEIVLNRQVTAEHVWRFEFVERRPAQPFDEPGFLEFARDASLSGDATAEELAFLKGLNFEGRRPTALYYYRELQSIRDPLHFRRSKTPAPEGRRRHRSPGS